MQSGSIELDDSPTERFERVARATLRVGFVFARDRIERRTLAASLESALGRAIELVRHATYADLSAAVTRGAVDLAWLPPAVYAGSRGAGGVRAVAALVRGGETSYRSALLARTSAFATLDEIVHARAAWVDPWSAAGYLMPRALLASHGIDLSRAIASERFHGSYDSAIDALTARTADLTGAFCTVDAAGKVVERGWSQAAPVRVLAISPPIPSDVLCTTRTLSEAECDVVAEALTGPAGASVGSSLGGTRLVVPEPRDYDLLAQALVDRGG